MASTRDIARRRNSVLSTGQITKAMKLVATVKLQKARSKAENAKPYFQYMYATVNSILEKTINTNNPYVNVANPDKKKIVIVVTSNRGLAGGYNNNVAKLVLKDERFTKENTEIFAIGNKGREALSSKGYNILDEACEVINDPLFSDAKEIGEKLIPMFENGQVSEIYIAYTIFKNTVSQVPNLLRLLPVEKDINQQEDNTPMNFEPEAEDCLKLIIPKYVNSIIYGALMESIASENGARMAAMDSATNNANELIEALSLKYNRARQSNITQELTEIIAGAEAIS